MAKPQRSPNPVNDPASTNRPVRLSELDALGQQAAAYARQDHSVSPRDRAAKRRRVGPGKRRVAFDLNEGFHDFLVEASKEFHCPQSDILIWLAVQGMMHTQPSQLKESLVPTRSLRFDLTWNDVVSITRAIETWKLQNTHKGSSK